MAHTHEMGWHGVERDDTGCQGTGWHEVGWGEMGRGGTGRGGTSAVRVIPVTVSYTWVWKICMMRCLAKKIANYFWASVGLVSRMNE